MDCSRKPGPVSTALATSWAMSPHIILEHRQRAESGHHASNQQQTHSTNNNTKTNKTIRIAVVDEELDLQLYTITEPSTALTIESVMDLITDVSQSLLERPQQHSTV